METALSTHGYNLYRFQWAYCINEIVHKHEDNQWKYKNIFHLKQKMILEDGESANHVAVNYTSWETTDNGELSPRRVTPLKVDTFLRVIQDHFGEIEAMRVEQYFSTSNDFSKFSFEMGMQGVKDLYKMDLDEVIEQCLNRVAPQEMDISVKYVRQGLNVNKATHTSPSKR